MSDVLDDGYSLPVENESVVARSKSNRGQHKCLGADPSQFPALQVQYVLALDLEGVHDVKLHHPSSSVATSNQ